MDTVYVNSGTTFETVLENAPSGLVGTVGVRIVDGVGNTVTARTTAGIIEEPAGSGRYVAHLVAPLGVGQYGALWDTDPGGVANPANSASQDIVVVSGASVQVIPTPDTSVETVGVCQLWCDPDDVAARLSLSPTPAEMIRYVEWACGLLFQLSGRRFSGACQRTLRPCRQGCGCWTPARWGLPVPYYGWDGGMWRHTGQGELGNANDECGCGVSQRVLLPYPTREVMEVKIDGATISPSTYRLDSQKWLTRITGNGGWPQCQNLELADGAVGTFMITVTYGAVPPIAGVEAATQLASELWKMNNPAAGECKLPVGVTQIVRQGLTITKQAEQAWVKGGTGLVAVDSFLAAYNPSGRRGRGRVWSPDLQSPARKVGP